MFSERYSDSSASDTLTQHGFICMSTTVDELSYTPSQEEKTRDAEQVVATGRKSWKTLRGRGEAVWPPILEAALIEALEKYQQEAIGSKAQKSGRFPMRNRFVSDYILETTGKTRTPKQVGSRLQQLRDTCKGDKILQLISHRGTPEFQTTGSQSDCSSRASMTPPPESAPSSLPSFIHVQISWQKELRPCPVPVIRLIENDRMNPYIIKLSPRPHLDPKIKASACSNLSYLSGTVEFPSPRALVLQSTFLVYLDGSHTPLHSEIAPLKCLSSPMQHSGGLYSSDIAPDFWDTLCSSPDLTRYTILQSLKPISSVQFDSNAVTESGRASPTVFIAYKFSYQQPAIQSSFDTEAPSVYPVTYPTSTSSHNQPVPMHTQWRVPPKNVDTKLSYSQSPLPNDQMSFSVPTFSESSIQPLYNTSQPSHIPVPSHHHYPVVDSHSRLNCYYPADSTLTTGSWSNERDTGQEYWRRRH